MKYIPEVLINTFNILKGHTTSDDIEVPNSVEMPAYTKIEAMVAYEYYLKQKILNDKYYVNDHYTIRMGMLAEALEKDELGFEDLLIIDRATETFEAYEKGARRAGFLSYKNDKDVEKHILPKIKDAKTKLEEMGGVSLETEKLAYRFLHETRKCHSNPDSRWDMSSFNGDYFINPFVELLIEQLKKYPDDERVQVVQEAIDTTLEGVSLIAKRQQITECFSSGLNFTGGVRPDDEQLQVILSVGDIIREQFSLDDLDGEWAKAHPELVAAATGVYFHMSASIEKMLKDMPESISEQKLQQSDDLELTFTA